MLTQSDLDQYQQQGYLVFEALIHGKRLAHYVALLDELVEQARLRRKQGDGWTYEMDNSGELKPEMLLHKIQGVCVVEPRVLDLAREPGIVQRVGALIGPNIDMFGSKFFPLLPGGGTSTKWHQDNYYFDTVSEKIVTCGIYLQDTDVENGCLKVVPRSHLWGPVEHVQDKGTYGSWVDVDESEAVQLEVPGGTVILFDANLLHGANKNVSNRSRYSTAWHYLPAEMELGQFRRGAYADRHIIQERRNAV